MAQPVAARPDASHAPAAPEAEWELGLAALAAIGLVGGSAMMLANARRRRESLSAEHDAFEDATATQAAAIAPRHEDRRAAVYTPVAPTPALPVPSGDAREDLVREMVAAPPDAENPFHTRKARRRRAQKILAQRLTDLRDSASRPFDWRTWQSTQRAAKEPVG